MTRFLCAEKADKKICKTRGEEQSKEVDSRQQHASSFKTQAQGRKDTPGRSKVSSSFKTQQTGQGRKPKAEFKVHSNLARRPNKNQWFTALRP
jgi:hypothetical protein